MSARLRGEGGREGEGDGGERGGVQFDTVMGYLTSSSPPPKKKRKDWN